jgi:hypothetical protein
MDHSPQCYYVDCEFHDDGSLGLETVKAILSKPPCGGVSEEPAFRFGLVGVSYETRTAKGAETICSWLQNSVPQIKGWTLSLEALSIHRWFKSL